MSSPLNYKEALKVLTPREIEVLELTGDELFYALLRIVWTWGVVLIGVSSTHPLKKQLNNCINNNKSKEDYYEIFRIESDGTN